MDVMNLAGITASRTAAWRNGSGLVVVVHSERPCSTSALVIQTASENTTPTRSRSTLHVSIAIQPLFRRLLVGNARRR